jgi:hypothetical protein
VIIDLTTKDTKGMKGKEDVVVFLRELRVLRGGVVF